MKDKEAIKGTTNQDQAPAGADAGMSGTWSGPVRWGLFSDPTTLVIKVNGSAVSGVWRSAKGHDQIPFSGVMSGKTIQFDYITPADHGHGHATIVLIAQNKIHVIFAAQSVAVTFSGELTRQ